MLFQLWDHPRPAESVFRRDGQVVVTSHRLAKTVLTDATRFSAGNALDAITSLTPATMRALARHRFRLPPTMANNATDSHPHLRELVGEAFHPGKVNSLRPWLTDLVRQQLVSVRSRLDAGEVVDLDAHVSAEIPLLALGRLLGVPSDATAEVKQFSRAALEMFWGRPDEERQLQLASVVGPYHARLREHIRTSTGTMGRVRDQHSEDTATAALFFLLVAGQETTAQFLTLLLHRLLTDRDLLTEVEPTQAGAIVEEGLRLFPSIVSWRRVARVDTQLEGFAINAGESVLVWLAAAGRDPAIVDKPEEFVAGQRGSRKHLAFGAGAHRCLGSQLTRLESEVVIAQAVPVLRECELVQAPSSPDNLSFRMPGPMLVRKRAHVNTGPSPQL
ncbi:cytochrome P450 [Natronoglycomyces albus]|uniref:Cytochrome P450 n=1 Tax=Natronoglycomyces albus TaxID=2811108 RepID=A0A895XMF7_9ACTN|nr:cytochrome P450 [Natronoglycomyces albus]QSB06307.1 cytochrome P450 [Natronoglycomyces albus]